MSSEDGFAICLASGIVALQMLVGHPQAAVYGILLCVGYGYYMGIVRRRGLLYFVVLSLVPVGGAILSAAQWLPTAELTELSIRSKGVSWRQFVNMSLPPERLFELLIAQLTRQFRTWHVLGPLGRFLYPIVSICWCFDARFSLGGAAREGE